MPTLVDLRECLRCNKSDDIRIGNVNLSELQVFRNGQGQLSKR